MSRPKATPPAPKEEPVEPLIELAEDEYPPIPVMEGDTFRIELTLPFMENAQTHWVKTAGEVAVLPGESAEDTADRAQEIALGLLFNTADRYKAILAERRKETLRSRNMESEG